MAQTHEYPTVGNTALACRWKGERDDTPRIIDFDIARRSHEARKRLAGHREGQIAGETPAGAKNHGHGNAGAAQMTIWASEAAPRENTRIDYPRQMTMQEAAVSLYHPNRGISQMLGEYARRTLCILRSHPLMQQLLHGGLEGRAPQRCTNRQLISAGILFVATSSAFMIIFG